MNKIKNILYHDFVTQNYDANLKIFSINIEYPEDISGFLYRKINDKNNQFYHKYKNICGKIRNELNFSEIHLNYGKSFIPNTRGNFHNINAYNGGVTTYDTPQMQINFFDHQKNGFEKKLIADVNSFFEVVRSDMKKEDLQKKEEEKEKVNLAKLERAKFEREEKIKEKEKEEENKNKIQKYNNLDFEKDIKNRFIIFDMYQNEDHLVFILKNNDKLSKVNVFESGFFDVEIGKSYIMNIFDNKINELIKK